MSNEDLVLMLRSVIQEELKPIINRLDKIEARLDNLEGQVRENSNYIAALLHRTEEMDAQLHALSSTVDKLCGQVNNLETKVISLETKVNNLEVQVKDLHAQVTDIKANMATKEDIKRVEYKISVINDRLLTQEYEIHVLKAAR